MKKKTSKSKSKRKVKKISKRKPRSMGTGIEKGMSARTVRRKIHQLRHHPALLKNPCGCLHKNPEDYGRFGQVERMTFKDAQDLLRINGIKLEKARPTGYEFKVPGTNISRFSYDLGGIVSEAMNYFGKPTSGQRDFDLSKWKTL